MKTAISIPDEVFDAAEETAKRLSMNRSELYTRAIREFLASHGHEGVTELLNEIYAEGSARLDPELARMQTRSLGEDQW